MKNIIAIIILIVLGTSCIQQKSDLKGTWISSNLSFYETITFGDSLFSNLCCFCYHDTIPYYFKSDTIIIPPNINNDEVTKYVYRILKDTLWLSFEFESEVNYLKYFRKKSDFITDDINLYHGLELDLPNGYSESIGLYFTNSIFFPNQDSNNGTYSIYLNNELLKLDTVFYKKMIELRREEIGLYIDLEVEYSAFKLLKDQLRKAECHSVIFISDPYKESYYVSTIGLRRKLPPIWANDIPASINICEVRILNNQMFIDEELFDINVFYNKMKKNNPFITYVNVDDSSNYSSYYRFISKHDSLKRKIRNERSKEHFKLEYNYLNDREKIRFVDSLTKINYFEK